MSEEQREGDSWEVNGLNSLDLWDYTVELECLQGTQDLQLAAELGKTLLERNKELETALRQHQNVIEDQAQEIEYLTKQTVALREVNDSRLRIYEQLEVSIQDLERANHRLALDHAADKKHIKSLCGNIESLEGRCEELQKTVEDLTSQLDVARRRAERKADPPDDRLREPKLEPSSQPKHSISPKKQNSIRSPNKSPPPPLEIREHEDLMRISDELRENKVAFAQEHRRVTELEEQLASMVQENNRLHDLLRDWHLPNNEPKSMLEEFAILEEVRQGQVCIRCLRGVDRAPADDISSMLDDDDDRSAISSLLLTAATPGDSPVRAPPQKFLRFENGREKLLQSMWSSNQDSSDNPYRELVQKYEALLEVQLSQVKNMRRNKTADTPTAPPPPLLSLHEELQHSGDFSQFSVKDTDEESGQGEEHKTTPTTKTAKQEQGSRKKFAQTPDFSEAETSSSGFSDETSNKATQTDKERPGSFLCTIADGEDYRFSIYDDASPMDGHFRNRPEYRELFKEIFTILKKAAENKDEGEKLPLLDDSAPPVKVPPVTPAHEDLPGIFTDDTQSVLSSVMSEQSIPLSDITAPDVTLKETDVIEIGETENGDSEDKENKESKPIETSTPEKPKEKALTPLVRQPLEYIAATRKKARHRRKHSADRQGADSPVFPSPPRITYQKGSSGRKRRDFRPIENSPLAKSEACEWNGATMQFYNRSLNSPVPSGSGNSRQHKVYQSWNPETDSWETKQSTASQEIHKLRSLELSYAEVLRNADKNKGRRKKHQ